MTLPRERTRAVLQLEEAVYALRKHAQGRGDHTRVEREKIRDLYRALRHYPTRADLMVSAEQAPTVWGDPDEDADTTGL